jgi:nitroreductase
MLHVPSVKRAATDYDIDPVLRARWSPRAFDSRPITREEALRLLEAARWAPSCANEQPWRFVVALRSDADGFDRLLSCLVEGNRRWAHAAGMLLLSVAQLTFDRNGSTNRHALHDVGLATANLLVQATAMGIAAHPMAGFDVTAARTVCQVPAQFEPVTMIALGYPGDPEILDEGTRAREVAPRQRRPLSELIFSGTWYARF